MKVEEWEMLSPYQKEVLELLKKIIQAIRNLDDETGYPG